jgi:hypothetical protein
MLKRHLRESRDEGASSPDIVRARKSRNVKIVGSVERPGGGRRDKCIRNFGKEILMKKTDKEIV